MKFKRSKKVINKEEVQSILETLYRRDYKEDMMLHWVNGLTEDDYVNQCKTGPNYKDIKNTRREIAWQRLYGAMK